MGEWSISSPTGGNTASVNDGAVTVTENNTSTKHTYVVQYKDGDHCGEYTFYQEAGSGPEPSDKFKVIQINYKIHNFTEKSININQLSFCLNSKDENGNYYHGKICNTSQPTSPCYMHCFTFTDVNRSKKQLITPTITLAAHESTDTLAITPSWENDDLYTDSNGCDELVSAAGFNEKYLVDEGTGGLGYRKADRTHDTRYGIQVYYGTNSYHVSAISSKEYNYNQKDLITSEWQPFVFEEGKTYHIYILGDLE